MRGRNINIQGSERDRQDKKGRRRQEIRARVRKEREWTKEEMEGGKDRKGK